MIESMGARAAIADALDAERLRTVVAGVSPSHVVHLLTALPPAGPMRPRDLRAKARVAEGRPRFAGEADAHRRLVEQFVDAVQRGDTEALATMLADDVAYWADGGGKVAAAQRPVFGRDSVVKLLMGLDIRDVFGRVSTVCEKAMTHDAMSISTPTHLRGLGGVTGYTSEASEVEGKEWTLEVTTGALSDLPTPFAMGAPTPHLLERHWDYELVADMKAQTKYDGTPSVNAGLRALLSIPVWVEGRLRATVNFYSHTPGHFTTDDVLLTRRIADHIALALAHQRLAEEARRNVELRAQAANLELLDELLAAMTDTAELRELFDRVSAVAKKVIPHDAMALAVLLPDGLHARRYASVGLDVAALPEVIPVPPGFVRDPNWEYDMAARPEPYNLRLASMGFRAALRVPIRIDGRFAAGLALMGTRRASTSRATFSRRAASRIGSRCASRASAATKRPDAPRKRRRARRSWRPACAR